MPAKKSAESASSNAKWTKAELGEIKKELLAEHERLQAELAATESDIAQLVSDSGDGAGDDVADAGSKTFEREQEMSIADNARDLMNQVDKALAKIDDGTYGVCESCGGSIVKARMRAFPRATLCIKCKEREERM